MIVKLDEYPVLLYILILVALLLLGFLAEVISRNHKPAHKDPPETIPPGAGDLVIDGLGSWESYPLAFQRETDAAATSSTPSSEAAGDGPMASIAETPTYVVNARAPQKTSTKKINDLIPPVSNAPARIKFNGQYHDPKDLAPSITYQTNRGMVVGMKSRIQRSDLVGCYCKVCNAIYTEQIWAEQGGGAPTVLKFSLADIWASGCPACTVLRSDYEAACAPWKWDINQTSLAPFATPSRGCNKGIAKMV